MARSFTKVVWESLWAYFPLKQDLDVKKTTLTFKAKGQRGLTEHVWLLNSPPTHTNEEKTCCFHANCGQTGCDRRAAEEGYGRFWLIRWKQDIVVVAWDWIWSLVDQILKVCVKRVCVLPPFDHNSRNYVTLKSCGNSAVVGRSVVCRHTRKIHFPPSVGGEEEGQQGGEEGHLTLGKTLLLLQLGWRWAAVDHVCVPQGTSSRMGGGSPLKVPCPDTGLNIKYQLDTQMTRKQLELFVQVLHENDRGTRPSNCSVWLTGRVENAEFQKLFGRFFYFPMTFNQSPLFVYSVLQQKTPKYA